MESNIDHEINIQKQLSYSAYYRFADGNSAAAKKHGKFWDYRYLHAANMKIKLPPSTTSWVFLL